MFLSGVDSWHRKPDQDSWSQDSTKNRVNLNQTKQFCWPIFLNLRKNCFQPLYTLCHCFNVFNSRFVCNWFCDQKNFPFIICFMALPRYASNSNCFLYPHRIAAWPYTAPQPVRLSNASVPFSSFVVASLFLIHQNIGNTHVLFSKLFSLGYQ